MPGDAIVPRERIDRGRIEPLDYDSETVGTMRRANFNLPPCYSTLQSYPVPYVLHGIGGDETEWIRLASPQILFDNLTAAGHWFQWWSSCPKDEQGGTADNYFFGSVSRRANQSESIWKRGLPLAFIRMLM